jgi:hypothetical protein
LWNKPLGIGRLNKNPLPDFRYFRLLKESKKPVEAEKLSEKTYLVILVKKWNYKIKFKKFLKDLKKDKSHISGNLLPKSKNRFLHKVVWRYSANRRDQDLTKCDGAWTLIFVTKRISDEYKLYLTNFVF